jgi:DNA polymerase I
LERLVIIDAAGALYRAYYAITSELSHHALFGFIRSLKKIQNALEPTHIVAVFDGMGNAESRKKIYADYKAHRQAMPEDLRAQYQMAKEYCTYAGISFLSLDGVEADDVIASLATQIVKKDLKVEVAVVSSDKDLCQIVTERISIINPHKEYEKYTPLEVKEIFGVDAEKIGDYLAITGDASDNIPGIPGLGKKAACTLLAKDISLQELLETPQKAENPRLQALLEKGKEAGLLSLALTKMDKELKVPLEEKDYIVSSENTEQLKKFYVDHHFFSFLKEMDQGSPEEKVSYKLIDTYDALELLIEKLTKAQVFVIDTETTDVHPLKAQCVGVGFAIEEGSAYYIPLNGPLEEKKVMAKLKSLLEDKNISLIGHNIKYDLLVLKKLGIHPLHIAFDTMIASHLLSAHQRRHSLDELALERLGKVKISIQDLLGKGKNALTIDLVPIEKVCEYCSEDVDYTLRLKNILEKELKERKLEDLFYNMELKLISVLVKMEWKGIFVDVEALKEMHFSVTKKLSALEEEIIALAGESFNLNSPKQLSEILFVKLQIPPLKKTATGNSTNVEVLEALQDKYPIAEKMLEFRMLEKLRSTYIDALPLEVLQATGRVHCSFSQSVAATGRLTCNHPNLQNIPVRTEEGNKIRSAFKPQKEGYSFLSADYSQIELRILAHFSQDPVLVHAFMHNQDVHASTAATIYGMDIKEVTKEQRRCAKIVNFGVLYGQGAFGLAKEMGCSMKEAQDFIDLYFAKFSGVKSYIDQQIKQVAQEKVTKTLLGRERLIPEIDSKNKALQKAAERLAVNTPLQGSAADLIKIAMLDIDKKIEIFGEKCSLILQVHDELIFEVEDSLVEELKSLVKSSMETCYPLNIPLIVDIAIGKNWQAC